MKSLFRTCPLLVVSLGYTLLSYGQITYVDSRNFYDLNGRSFSPDNSSIRQAGRSTLDTSHKQLRPNTIIFAGHPAWLKGAYVNYDFARLTHVAFYGFTLTKTGWTANESEARNLVRVAHLTNRACKVLLTARLPTGFAPLLTKKKRDKAVESLLDKLTTLGADGINLDVSSLAKDSKEHREILYDFLSILRERMQAINRAYALVMTVPAQTNTTFYQFLVAHQSDASFYIVGGYDYNQTLNPSREAYLPGPIAPLKPNAKWGLYNIASSVAAYRNNGIDPAKLVITLPLLAKVWGTREVEDPKTFNLIRKDTLLGYMTYRTLRSQKTLNVAFDSSSQSRYYSLIDVNTGDSLKAWAEDTVSLSRKINWVLAQNLRGVAIWSPAFSDGLQDVWRLVDSKFVVPRPPKLINATFPPYQEVAFFVIAVLAFFVMVGVLVAITGTGNVILTQHKARVSVSLLILLCLAMVFAYLTYIDKLYQTPWFAGGLIGVVFVTFALATVRYLHSRQLP